MAHELRTVLWFDGRMDEAASFYVDTFPDTRIERKTSSPSDWPNGKAGDTITVDMTVCGRSLQLLNGGPDVIPNDAVSLMIETEDQDETDRLWTAILDAGGQEVMCGWIKDPYGFSWQITPRRLNELVNDDDPQVARRAFEAMMQMVKLDIATIENVVAGKR